MTLQEVLRRFPPKRGSALRRTSAAVHVRPLALVFALCVASTSGCAVGVGTHAPGAGLCAQLDSVYAHSGFERALTVTGKATIDANQYQIRGIIRAEFYPSGDVSFDFSSSVLFGSQIEDFFFSLAADTLRIVDRERGHLYQDDEALEFLRETLGMDFDVASALRLAAGGKPPCDEIETLRTRAGSHGDVRFDGRYQGESFAVRFSGPGGRLDGGEWAVRGDDGRKDRLRTEYRWADSAEPRLRQLVLRLDAREWRCKITATD